MHQPITRRIIRSDDRQHQPRSSASAGFPKRPAIFEQVSPKHEQGHKSRQYQRCERRLNVRETGRVFAKKPARNNAANPQQ
jgi:hypothetical protein